MRTNSFDFLRLFAAVSVVIGHSVPFLGISFFWFSQHGKQADGYFFLHAVPLFFILSGFLIYKSYERSVETNRPTWHFYMNRVLRIVPAIYVFTVLIVVIFLIVGILSLADFSKIPVLAWIASNFALMGVYHPAIFENFGVGVVNGSLWTIPAEFGFYIFVPLLFLIEKRYKFKKMITLLLVFSFFSGLLLAWAETWSYEPMWVKFYKVTFIPHFLYFVLGIFWSKVWERTPKNWSLFFLSIGLFLLVDAYLINVFDNFFIKYLLGLVWAVALSYAAIYFGFFGPKVLGKLTNKIGDLSFGIYIWHMIVVNFFIYYNVKDNLDVPDLGLMLIVLSISFVLATLSWNFIEKPALGLKPYNSRNAIKQNFKEESKSIESA